MARGQTETSDSQIKDLRDRYEYGVDAWRKIRDEAQKDMKYVAGDPWEPKARKAREDANRPVLSLDELGQFVNQIINDVRQNKRGIKVAPEGDGATDKTAEVRQNLIRQIEYRSNAQQAYTTMFENAVQRSYGYLRIKPVYADRRSFDQELRIEALPNPDMVTPDPDALRPDGADWKDLYLAEEWRTSEFKRKFPKAKIVDFDTEAKREAPGWVKGDGERIIVAEAWKIKTRKRKLLLIQPAQPAAEGVLGLGPQPAPVPPVAIFEDELEGRRLPRGASVIRDREVDFPEVYQCLTNGLEVLEENDFPGTSIPFVACYGKVLYVDEGAGTERKILSMVRLARDPFMLYCYYRTCEAELVGMTPKTPFVGYEGQFRGHEADWQRAAHEPVAYLEARPTVENLGQQLLPLPQRQPYDPPIQSLEVGAESARRAIQAAMGTSPLPTQAQRRNEKSGIALQRMEDSAQRGSYHFIDHYDEALTRTGAIIDELIPHYYDAARDVTIRTATDEPKMIRINDPNASEPADVTTGRHDVTISVGPAFASQREAAEDFADTLAGNPAVFPIIADLVVKLKQLGPIGDEIADRLTPPQFKQQKEGEPPSPAEIAQMQQQMQQIQQALQEAQQYIATEQAKQEATIEKAKIEAERDIQLEKMRGEITMLKAQIDARAKGLAAEQSTAETVVKLGAEAVEAERKRNHDREMASKQAEQAASSQAHEHAHASQLAAQKPKTGDK